MVDNDKLRLIHELREQGVDWQTINDTIPEFTDNDRKVYRGWLIGKEEQGDSNFIKHAKTLQKIRQSRKELGIERSINNEQIRDISLHKTFTQQVLDTIKENHKHNKTFTPAYQVSTGDNHHIFSMSDFHYDGDKDTLNVFNNAYGAIMSVVDEKDIQHIHLLELGDTIEGASLRTSQLMAVKSGMVNQIIEVAKAYVDFLSELSKHVNISFYSVDSSNHTQLRPLGTKQNQLVEEDLMQVLNVYIETALPDLDFIHDKDIITQIGEFNFMFTHGHLIKGNPDKYFNKLQSDRNVLFDFVFYGHWHHTKQTDWHSKGIYDSKIFQVPALAQHTTSYEEDKSLSSMSGIGYYRFNDFGHVESRKLLV